MKTKNCLEFQKWLDDLPERSLGKDFKSHLKSCKDCCRQYDLLGRASEVLMEIPVPGKLNQAKINRFTAAAEAEVIKKEYRKTALKVGRNALIGLPFVLVINWLWITLGSSILTNLLSPDIARIYFIVFLVGTSLLSASIFGAIPILWGYLYKQASKECAG